MNWIFALSAGAGLGLAYFGGLWLTVIGVVRQPSGAVLVPVSGAARFILLGLGLAILSRQGTGSILAALGGLWLSRWYMLRTIGGVRHGK
jgi:F1F0 ATPase subunit 2